MIDKMAMRIVKKVSVMNCYRRNGKPFRKLKTELDGMLQLLQAADIDFEFNYSNVDLLQINSITIAGTRYDI